MYQSAVLSGVVSLDDGKFKASLKQMEGASESTFKKIADAAAAYLTVKMLGNLVKSSVTAFVTQENAVEDVRASLRNLGAEVDANAAKFQKFASDIQAKTTFGDETVLAAMSQGMRLGIRPDDIEQVTTAAVGLTAKLGVDLPTAMQLLARASQGHTQALARYGVAIDENKSKEEQFQEVLKIGADSFRLAEDAAHTAGGKLKQAGADLGDAWEKVGEEFVPVVLACAAALKGLAYVFNDADKSTRTVIVSATALGVVLGILVKTGVLAKANAIALAIAHGVSAIAATGNAAAHGALAVAMHAAAVAANTLNAALGPIGWAILAISAAVVGVNYLLDRENDKIEGQVKATKMAAANAAKYAAETEKLHKKQNEGIARLQELEKYERLNSGEQEEARRIIEDLKKAYGNLDVSIDKTTGKVRIATNAWAGLTEEQRRLEKAALKNKWQTQVAYKNALWKKARKVIGGDWVWNEKDNQKLQDIKELPLLERIKKLNEWLNAATEANDDKAANMLKELIEAEETLHAYGREMASYDENHKKGAAAGAAAENKAMREEITKVTEARWKIKFDSASAEEQAQMLKKKIEGIFAEYKRQGRFSSVEQMLNADPTKMKTKTELEDLRKIIELEKERQKLLTQSARAFEEEEKALERFEAERQQQIDSAEQERELKRLEQTGDADAINSFLYTQLHNAADAAVALRTEYEEAIAEAKKDNIMTEAEKSKIAELFDAYQRALSDQDKWQDRIDDREENGEIRKAVGSFSAAVLAAQLGANKTPEKETAENTKKMVRLQRQLLDQQKKQSNTYQ